MALRAKAMQVGGACITKTSISSGLGIRSIVTAAKVQLQDLAIRQSSSSSSDNTENPVTHTGQKWDKNDYRMARFELAPKQVSPNWAINLVAEVPPKKTDKRVVWCDGGSGPEGHPRVYINLDKPGNHSCGYCGLRFEKEDHHH